LPGRRSRRRRAHDLTAAAAPLSESGAATPGETQASARADAKGSKAAKKRAGKPPGKKVREAHPEHQGKSEGPVPGESLKETAPPISETPEVPVAVAAAAGVQSSAASEAAEVRAGTAEAFTSEGLGILDRRSARVHKRRPNVASASVAPTLLPVSLVADTAAGAQAPKSSRHGGSGSRTPRHSSEIVHTITKIVGVVPGALWAAILALVAIALGMAGRSAFTQRRSRRLSRQREQLLADVGTLQAALLPVAPERLGVVGTSVAYRPATGPAAGGDFYDLFALEDGRIAVIVGDVSGHGRDALPHTALLRFTLRAYLEAGLSPRDAVSTAGAVLDRQLSGAFATVVAAVYDPAERTLVYSCAGHPPPLVLGAGQFVPVTVCSAPPIGVGVRSGTRQTTVAIPGSATVCFYTDGVAEARAAGELYGRARIERSLAALDSNDGAEALLHRVGEEADTSGDDMAACVLRIAGDSAAVMIAAEELELERDQADSARARNFLAACGVEPSQTAELVRSACERAGSAGTVVLEVRPGGRGHEVSIRRDHLAHLAHRRTHLEAAR
jgi:hypothetical protein